MDDTKTYKKIESLDDLESNHIPDFYSGYEICFDLHLDKLRNSGKVIFYDCIFSNKIFINSMNPYQSFSTMLEFSDCIFKDIIKCNNITFNNMLVIKNRKKERAINLQFYNVEFDDTVIFKGLIINDFILKEVEFNEESFFYNIDFNNKLDFIDTYFYKGVYFDGSIITAGNRRTARIIKDSFEQQNNIIEANKFYALEMEKREEELKDDVNKGKNFFEYLVFLFHSLSSNHSQNWVLALFWIISSTFGYTILNCYEFKNNIFFGMWIVVSIIVALGIGLFLKEYIKDKIIHTIFMGVFLFIYYLVYGLTLEDFSLYKFSNNLNPFSIMTEFSDLNFLTLIFKITIAYLIYQLIVSIRQNTRRK